MNLVADAAKDFTTDGNSTRICPQTIYSITWEVHNSKTTRKINMEPQKGLEKGKHIYKSTTFQVPTR